jgi:hypothetical protein
MECMRVLMVSGARRLGRQNGSVVSRRNLLGVGAGFLAMGLKPEWSPFSRVLRGSDLFVFKAQCSNRFVTAVTFRDQMLPLPSGDFKVCVYVGAKSWTISGPASGQVKSIADDEGSRAFAGDVLRPLLDAGAGHERYKAVVLETAAGDLHTHDTLDVWAEIFTEGGPRFRIGNPFVTEIMTRNRALSKLHHGSSPSGDRALLLESIERQIALIASARGIVADPEAHGRRLAAMILPDVIRYSPLRPVGFSFSDWNGRHPDDPTSSVVATILTGAAAPLNAPRPAGLSNYFPYFLIPTTAA